jgi:hypothetical protein
MTIDPDFTIGSIVSHGISMNQSKWRIKEIGDLQGRLVFDCNMRYDTASEEGSR